MKVILSSIFAPCPFNFVNEKNKKDTDLIFEHTIVANGTSSVHYLPDILESAGTMRYYGLGTILNILLERNAIIPVDELIRS